MAYFECGTRGSGQLQSNNRPSRCQRGMAKLVSGWDMRMGNQHECVGLASAWVAVGMDFFRTISYS